MYREFEGDSLESLKESETATRDYLNHLPIAEAGPASILLTPGVGKTEQVCQQYYGKNAKAQSELKEKNSGIAKYEQDKKKRAVEDKQDEAKSDSFRCLKHRDSEESRQQ